MKEDKHVEIDAELHKKLKLDALMHGIKMRDLTTLMLNCVLQDETKYQEIIANLEDREA